MTKEEQIADWKERLEKGGESLPASARDVIMKKIADLEKEEETKKEVKEEVKEEPKEQPKERIKKEPKPKPEPKKVEVDMPDCDDLIERWKKNKNRAKALKKDNEGKSDYVKIKERVEDNIERLFDKISTLFEKEKLTSTQRETLAKKFEKLAKELRGL